MTIKAVVTVADTHYGIKQIPQGVRRERVNTWLTDDLTLRFEARVLPIDARTGDCRGYASRSFVSV
jgi:hypothetical protein